MCVCMQAVHVKFPNIQFSMILTRNKHLLTLWKDASCEERVWDLSSVLQMYAMQLLSFKDDSCIDK